jgi:hypothetical protein
LSLAFIGLVPACSGGGPKLHPVRGKVLFLDQPADGATVVFHPVAGGADAPKPAGQVGADGSFTLTTTPRGAGAPAGEYVVCVAWYPPNARELDNPKNKVPEKYGSPTTSPLRATVKEGSNELEPFRLTK